MQIPKLLLFHLPHHFPIADFSLMYVLDFGIYFSGHKDHLYPRTTEEQTERKDEETEEAINAAEIGLILKGEKVEK